MLKRILPIIMLSCMLPTVSHASWFLNTWVKSGGGVISVDGGASQTVAKGSVFTSHSNTDTAHTVTVSANSGFTISKLEKSSGASCTGDSITQTCTVQGPPDQNIYATFLPAKLSIAATAGAGGSVNIASFNDIYYGTSLSGVRKFYFTPQPGYSVISVTGVPAGATVTPSVPAGANSPVAVTLPNGFLFTSNIALSATFSGPPVAKTAPSQIVPVNSLVTLDGSPSTGTINLDGTVTPISTYTWTQTGGPATVVLNTATSMVKPTFTPTIPGNYIFNLTVDGGSSAYVNVTVTQDAASTVLTQCENCHAANGIGAAKQVYSNWNSSLHEKNYVTCVNCHVGANSGAHPGISNPALSNICSTCHTAVPSNHPIDTAGNNACATCHDPHSLAGNAGTQALPAAHYNNITSARYPASYMTSKAACTNCHNGNANNQTIRLQWAQSGHAATNDLPWTNYDFKTMSGCVQCHTTTGFIAYSTARVTAAWGVATDKTKELLTCIGCHSDVANGIVRTVTPNQPFAGEPAYTNRDVGISNICMDCHSGRNNGVSIQAQTAANADFTNIAFIAPHYLAAGGTLHGKSGYEFPGRTYLNYSGNSHRKIGMTNNNSTGTDGPCATCHISSAFNGAKHTFKAISSATGAVVAITTTVCTNCHASAMTPSVLETDREQFNNALAVLQAALNDKGFTYSSSYPYFAAKNWGTGQAGANNMGAAFNYVLLLNEPGAYVHYSLYAKQLITDSIDAVHNNGAVSGDITGALNDLSAKGLITNDQVASMNTFNNQASSCGNCHGNPPATASHSNIASYTSSAPSCASCHVWTGPGGPTHNNGTVDLKSGASACTGCHGYPPGTAVLGASTYTHTSSTCTDCHDTPASPAQTATHRDGVVEVLTNATACSSCHSYPPASHATYNVVAGTTPNCAACHTYTGFNGPTHNNGAVDLNGDLACDTCHGYPPLPANILASRANGEFVNARVENYAGGGGFHASHLLPTLTADQGFTPCLPCHPSGATHNQGHGTVAQANVNVFDPADTSFRLNAGLPKVYNADTTCSNVSCHFQPSPAWKQ
jgi:hypothetical protein